MAVPEEVRKVERPKNTVVVQYGDGKYAVKQRVGCKNVGGRRVPVDGPTVGHITGMRYVPVVPDTSEDGPELKDWANVVLCDTLFKDVLDDLRKFYSPRESLQIYCMAILRVCRPGIKDNELKSAYDESFLSEMYPGVGLSKNTVCSELNSIGKAYGRIIAFMRDRVSRVCRDHHLLIDGTLKSDESDVNSLSDYSRKVLTKGARDISVLYAYDLNDDEIICSTAYPGNMQDDRAMEDFIEINDITRGLIVADKGFTEPSARKAFMKNPDLHYLLPLKRNAKVIAEYRMYSFSGLLKGYDGITYRKEKEGGSAKWLYSYRDASKAASEERVYLETHKGSYDPDDHGGRAGEFGTIVFESDVDMGPAAVYKAYADRWLIETIFRFYKDVNDFDETREHDDYSVMASEFVNFLSSVLTNRLLKRFSVIEALEDVTYGKTMKLLARGKKIKIDGRWKLRRLSVYEADILADLGLLNRPVSVKNPVGRPRKRAQA